MILKIRTQLKTSGNRELVTTQGKQMGFFVGWFDPLVLRGCIGN